MGFASWLLTYVSALLIILLIHETLGEVAPFHLDHQTNWTDEQAMRERMSKYAEEKFSHRYHELNNLLYGTRAPIMPHIIELEMRRTNRVQPQDEALGLTQEIAQEMPQELPQEVTEASTTMELRAKRDVMSAALRKKRDGGIASGPAVAALVTGVIGMTAKTVSDLTSFQPQVSQGGCAWFGTAPLCSFPCPSDFDFIREHNGRCSSRWLSGFCSPDESFGKPCTTILGNYFTKRFCCKADPIECSWSGRWMSANLAHNIYCRYDNVGRCGMLDCSINHHSFKATNLTEISGDRCDRLELFGMRGKATCGYIAWFSEDGEVVNSWYKTSFQPIVRNDG